MGLERLLVKTEDSDSHLTRGRFLCLLAVQLYWSQTGYSVYIKKVSSPASGTPEQSSMACPRRVKFLRLARMPVLQMLQLEEALLRATTSNWFMINDGAPEACIVMGISGWVADGRFDSSNPTCAASLIASSRVQSDTRSS